MAPRGAQGFDVKGEPLADGEQAITVTGGVIISVANLPGVGLLDIEADRLVIWTKGRDQQQLITNLQNSKGLSTNELEFYLSGNVEIRETDGPNLRHPAPTKSIMTLTIMSPSPLARPCNSNRPA